MSWHFDGVSPGLSSLMPNLDAARFFYCKTAAGSPHRPSRKSKLPIPEELHSKDREENLDRLYFNCPSLGHGEIPRPQPANARNRNAVYLLPHIPAPLKLEVVGFMTEAPACLALRRERMASWQMVARTTPRQPSVPGVKSFVAHFRALTVYGLGV